MTCNFLSRLKVAKDLTYLLLFYLLSTIGLVGLGFATARGGEDHVIDKLVNALAVGIIEDLADDTLEKGFILELNGFLMPSSAFVMVGVPIIISI